MGYIRTFGEIDGHPPGSKYRNRREIQHAGLHAHNQRGISGTAREGADAIVLNGGYPDDQDEGDIIIYTGEGGQSAEKKQIADQVIEGGNAALVKSHLEGLPVRVIRGHGEKSKYAPRQGYEYSGLYRIQRYWFKKREDGFQVLQFRLTFVGDADGISHLIQLDEGATPEFEFGHRPVERTSMLTERLKRRLSVVRNVKEWHDNRCQICGTTLMLPSGPASQVAHIQGLGIPHNGPDIEANALCLCPNDHVLFDNGAYYLTDDLKVVDAIKGSTLRPLRTHKRHLIGLNFVRQHRSYWTK
ncbi:hypothetical protein Sru01_50690 [Sphaerisporangium rufum]|uniref:YDG domain-containing protein n=1 Tax=Sphaerisporangium rufum TaxID=1381558 RepID=A0A919R5I8_9ACTN|nr:YDG/SRA domain-containing protein [Sphaerisporangium rufum]GII80087.1 hypothetical protein Sru01_50690 [Sphaerisporangium rufum]